MRKPLMAGNWKMNLNHLEAIAVAQKLVYSLDDKDYDAVDVAIIPPFTDIRSIQTLIDGDRLRLTYGAQDLSPEASGAFTGDIAGSMLHKLGCTFVLIGHSERRAIHGESDALINRKIKAALANEIITSDILSIFSSILSNRFSDLSSVTIWVFQFYTTLINISNVLTTLLFLLAYLFRLS